MTAALRFFSDVLGSYAEFKLGSYAEFKLNNAQKSWRVFAFGFFIGDEAADETRTCTVMANGGYGFLY